MSEANNPGQPLRLDPDAESADPELPAFIARPEGAPVYHGFPVVPEIETDGWLYCAITDYECDSPQTDGDGFVIAPMTLAPESSGPPTFPSSGRSPHPSLTAGASTR